VKHHAEYGEYEYDEYEWRIYECGVFQQNFKMIQPTNLFFNFACAMNLITETINQTSSKEIMHILP
jgi:hypothetical protein